MSIEPQALLQDILAVAHDRGLDQKRLAHLSGVPAETISRAKKRGTVDLKTLEQLAKAVDARICLSQVSPIRENSPLTDPKWGLAWSNRQASTESVVRAALIKGAYTAILEAVVHHGLQFVQDQWSAICANQAPKQEQYVAAMLRNIAIGVSRAQA